ncbi:MAG: TlyA family RNA methyltransferase [Thermaceae bacterium]
MRLDVFLVEQKLAESRAKAQDLIRRGLVLVNGKPATKPALRVEPTDQVELSQKEVYVSRGAYKLLPILEELPFSLQGRTAADLGASTGGFTQILLEKGVARVYAVDVGKGQLHPRLRKDPRVVVLEGQDARQVALPTLDLVVMDVSFISSTLLLPKAWEILRPGGMALVLVKPQFELWPGAHKGVVREEGLRQLAVEKVKGKALELGFQVLWTRESPLPGREGNQEVWLLLRRP